MVDHLVASLLRRGRDSPDDLAYEFLREDGAIEVMSYGDLLRHAFGLAARLSRPAPGGRGPLLLLFPPGLDYVAAVFACLLAGRPAVPAYPPDPWRTEAGFERLRAISASADITGVVCGRQFENLVPLIGLAGVPVEIFDRADTRSDGAEADSPEADSPAAGGSYDDDGIALIQYTSGSTQSPRGAIIRHGNLRANIAAIGERFELNARSRALVWLPPYHDMGLIGGILTPLAFGFPVRLLSPLQFLGDPLIWLEQIQQSAATVSGGPDFAYDLCTRRAQQQPDRVGDLRLGTWEVAFDGAEPIRARTLRRFADRFSQAGFRARSFVPCYGLAEATLLVSSMRWDPSAGSADGDDRVACGTPVAGHDVAIVGAEDLTAVPAGQEGEIWVRGPSVSSGYWGSAEMPAGFLDGARYLRTGDIGRIVDGQLVICGRLKDIIVREGRNHHAADIENAVMAVQGIRQVAAAFSYDIAGREAAALVVELAREGVAGPGLGAELRSQVAHQTGLRLDCVAVVPAGTIPKTSSGKVRRAETRMRLLAGEYDAWQLLGAKVDTS